MATIGSLFVSIGVKTADLEKGLNSAKTKLSGFASGAAKVGAVAGGAVVTGAGAMGAAIVAAGDASLDLQRNLDATRRQLGDLSDQELLDATHNAQLLEKAFGTGMDENIQAAGVLMKEFGLNSSEAFDFLATGYEKGLNNSDDFLDSIGEYSNLFAQNGFAAEEFFSTMETGMAGGVLGTDKIADAFKEAGIRIQELDDDMLDSLEMIGVNVDAMFQGLQDGEVTVADAINTILPAIQSMENPIQRNAMGVKIFGTQWEDLGQQIVTSVDTGKTSLDDLAGSTDALGEKWASLGTFFSQGMDQVLLALSPATDAFLQFVNDNQPVLDEFFNKLTPLVSDFATELSERLGPAALLVDDALQRIGVAFGIIDESGTGMDTIINAIGGALNASVTGIEAAAVASQLLADAIEGLNTGITDFNGNASSFAGKIGQISGQLTGIGGLRQGWNQIKSGSPGLFGFADGGVVPGPKGAAQLAVVHGGETIIPPGMAQAGTTINIDGITVSQGDGGVDEALRQAFEVLRSKLSA